MAATMSCHLALAIGERKSESAALTVFLLLSFFLLFFLSFTCALSCSLFLPPGRLAFSNQLQFTKLRQFGDENVVRGKAAGDLMISRQVSARAGPCTLRHPAPPCRHRTTRHCPSRCYNVYRTMKQRPSSTVLRQRRLRCVCDGSLVGVNPFLAPIPGPTLGPPRSPPPLS